MKLNIWFPFLLSVALLFSGCVKDDNGEEKPEMGERTVLVYMVAENSLYRFVYGDVLEMLAGCGDIPDNSKIVLYVDDLDFPRIYTLTNKTQAASMYYLTAEYDYEEDPNSCSADVLRQVMRYVVKHHPAKKYGMVFWSHASGWVPGGKQEESASGKSRKMTFGVDNQRNVADLDSGFEMDIMEMASALEEFDNLEFALFDACFMQTIETAYELRNVFKYIIGSPAEIPGPGAPYDKIIKAMFTEEFNPDNLTKAYYDYYHSDPQQRYGVLISSVNTSRLEEFAVATRNALRGISLRDGDFVNVQNYFLYDRWDGRSLASMPDCYDMKSIMQENLPKDRYAEWEKVLNETVTGYATDQWFSSYPGIDGGFLSVDSAKYGGVSMYVPLQKYMDQSKPFVKYYYKTSWWNAINN